MHIITRFPETINAHTLTGRASQRNLMKANLKSAITLLLRSRVDVHTKVKLIVEYQRTYQLLKDEARLDKLMTNIERREESA